MKKTAILLAALIAIPAMAMTTADLNNVYKQLDAAMNSEYQRYLKMLSPQEQTELRTEQRVWVAKRNKKCGAPEKASTDQQIMCLGDMTSERMDDFSAPASHLSKPAEFR